MNIFDRIQEADAVECLAALRDLAHLRAALYGVTQAGLSCEGVLSELQREVAGEVDDVSHNLSLDALTKALDERLTHLEAKDQAA